MEEGEEEEEEQAEEEEALGYFMLLPWFLDLLDRLTLLLQVGLSAPVHHREQGNTTLSDTGVLVLCRCVLCCVCDSTVQVCVVCTSTMQVCMLCVLCVPPLCRRVLLTACRGLRLGDLG